MSFSELGLNSDCLATLEQAGYKEPTELQRQLIPLIKDKKNVLVKSQSASGKTGAFLIPAINYVLENPLEDHQGARIMILTSRKDRVNQIKYTVKKLGTNQNFRFGFIVSGRPYQPQMRLLRRPLDIMVATPGRLSDLSDNGKADFSQLEMLIVDDLASIYHKEFHGLIDKIMSQRSTEYPIVLFVRNDQDVVDYANTLIPNAIELEVEEDKHPLSRIPQILHICDDYTHKIAIMDYLLDDYADSSTLIYTSSQKSALNLSENLANHGHAVDVITQISPEEQENTSVLIVSDEHINDLKSGNYKNVIHFELPKSITSYEARLAGKGWEDREEAVVALLGIQERESLKQIEELIGTELEKRSVPGLESLNPFMTLKPDFSNKSGQQQNTNNKQKRRNSGQFGKRRGSGNSNGQKANNDSNKQQRRTKKGRFGRLSGGIHRKREEDTPTRPQKAKAGSKPAGGSRNTPKTTVKKKSNYSSQGKKSLGFKSNKRDKWSDNNSGSAFPVIKDPDDAVASQNKSDAKVVVRYKDKKRFLKQD